MQRLLNQALLRNDWWHRRVRKGKWWHLRNWARNEARKSWWSTRTSMVMSKSKLWQKESSLWKSSLERGKRWKQMHWWYLLRNRRLSQSLLKRGLVRRITSQSHRKAKGSGISMCHIWSARWKEERMRKKQKLAVKSLRCDRERDLMKSNLDKSCLHLLWGQKLTMVCRIITMTTKIYCKVFWEIQAQYRKTQCLESTRETIAKNKYRFHRPSNAQLLQLWDLSLPRRNSKTQLET